MRLRALLLVVVGATDVEPTLRTFAPCAGLDWRVLQLIAKRESELDPKRVSKDGYIGLFQTRPENCRAVLVDSQLRKRCNELTSADVNTAVAVTMARAARALVAKACSAVTPRDELAMIYLHHNVGEGAAAAALRSGCDHDKLLAGLTSYYRGKVKKPEAAAKTRIGHAYEIADAAIAADAGTLTAPDSTNCPL